MANTDSILKQESSLGIQDYLEATSDASKRTRTVVIILVVASVLTLVGFLNSLQTTWMLQRVRALCDPNSKYVLTKIGPPPNLDLYKKEYTDGKEALEKYTHAFGIYKQHYNDFSNGMIKTYIESTYIVRVPFFGISFDINDLGTLSGVAFITILILFRFCLSREIDNLKISFAVTVAWPTRIESKPPSLSSRENLPSPPLA